MFSIGFIVAFVRLIFESSYHLIWFAFDFPTGLLDWSKNLCCNRVFVRSLSSVGNTVFYRRRVMAFTQFRDGYRLRSVCCFYFLDWHGLSTADWTTGRSKLALVLRPGAGCLESPVVDVAAVWAADCISLAKGSRFDPLTVRRKVAASNKRFDSVYGRVIWSHWKFFSDGYFFVLCRKLMSWLVFQILIWSWQDRRISVLFMDFWFERICFGLDFLLI